MQCDQTNDSAMNAKRDKSCAGAQSAGGSGCRHGSPAWPRHVVELHRIASTPTPGLSGNSATAASLTTGGECCTGDCRQGRDCPQRAEIETDRGAMLLTAALLIAFWAYVAMVVRSCA